MLSTPLFVGGVEENEGQRRNHDGDDEDDEHQARSARDLARDMAFEAARVATHAADPHWEIKVLLRASDALDRCGDHDDAITLQTRAMTLMVRHPDVSDATIDGDNAPHGRMM